jgi:hypothetical protein
VYEWHIKQARHNGAREGKITEAFEAGCSPGTGFARFATDVLEYYRNSV